MTVAFGFIIAFPSGYKNSWSHYVLTPSVEYHVVLDLLFSFTFESVTTRLQADTNRPVNAEARRSGAVALRYRNSAKAGMPAVLKPKRPLGENLEWVTGRASHASRTPSCSPEDFAFAPTMLHV
ncbi:hypothetical protein [Paraburkholderia dipogonis]|uniref:hypothetical protein n=1 Tax=Paraburkholderia dipogonis TaxID=1211383 RepID=UPI00366EE620